VGPPSGIKNSWISRGGLTGLVRLNGKEVFVKKDEYFMDNVLFLEFLS